MSPDPFLFRRHPSLLLPIVLALSAGAACTDDDAPSADASTSASPDAMVVARDAAPSADAAAPRDASTTPADAAGLPDAVVVAADAGVATDAAIEACPLDPEGKALLENIVHTLVVEIGVVTEHVGPREAAFVAALPATEISFQNFAFLIDTCNEPTVYVPSCTIGEGGQPDTEGFFAKHDLCSRISCEAAGILVTEMWMTMIPNTDPAMRHVFTYDTEIPKGIGVSDPNPFLTWRADLRTPDEAHVTANLDWKLTVTSSATGNVLVADFDALARGDRVMVGGNPRIAVSANVTFPQLGAVPLTATASIGANHVTTGEIRTPSGVIGAVVARTSSTGVDWSGPCQ